MTLAIVVLDEGADLGLIDALRGPETVPWNRQAKCRRIGCDGVVEFRGKNPKI